MLWIVAVTVVAFGSILMTAAAWWDDPPSVPFFKRMRVMHNRKSE